MKRNLMRKRLLISTICILSGFLSYGQTVTKVFSNTPLKTVLKEVEKQSGMSIMYETVDVNASPAVTASFNDASVATVLESVLDSSLDYSIEGKIIVIYKKSGNVSAEKQQTLPRQNTQRMIRGLVTDETDSPVVGATVIVKGTAINATTDINGEYTIVAEPGNIIVFSFLGYQSVEVEVSDRVVLDVKMAPAATPLDEVMVVAYGVAKKSSFSGSAAVVHSQEITANPSASFEKSLQGKVAGLQVAAASGQPGASTTYRIRGTGSLNGSNEPLYVIDGVATTSADYSKVADRAYSTSSILSSLNPQDIESVTVLKDAAAASLYGSRAANGVVIITTKSGKSGEGKLSFNAQLGVASVPKTFDLMNSAEYYQVVFSDYYNTRMAAGHSAADAALWANAQTQGLITFNPFSMAQPFGADGKLVSGAHTIVDTDWQDEVFNPALTQDYNLSFSGGTDAVSYYVSGGYYNQDGTTPAANFKRYSGKANIDARIKKWLKAGLNTTFSYSEQNTEVASGAGASPLYNALKFPSGVPVYLTDAQGNYILDEEGNKQFNWLNPVSKDFNPVAIPHMDIWLTKTYRFLASFYAQVEFTKGLTFKSTFSPDYVSLYEIIFWNKEHGNGPAYGGRSERHQTHDLMFTSTNTLNYDTTLADNHHLSAMLGYEVWKSKREYALAQGTGFAFDFMTELDAAASALSPSSYTTQESLISYIARAEYDYAGKYFVSGSFRRDGSSVFGSDNKWGNFWSAGASWRLDQENFIKNVHWINTLKVRASYGTSGNNRGLERYQSLGLWSASADYNYANASGFAHTQLSNPGLGWEKQAMLNLGVDFAFLSNRLYGSLEYFHKTSKDLLYEYPLPTSTGFESIMMNMAKVQNAGLEFELSANIIRGKEWNWNLQFNISGSRDKILDLAGDDDLPMDLQKKIWKIGYSQYEFYMPTWAGVDPATGAPLWVKDNGTTSDYSSATNEFQGRATPDFYGGLTNTVSWKGFDLSVFLFYSVGGLVYDGLYATVLHEGNSPGSQLHKDALNAWTPTNTNTNIPKYSNSNSNLSNSASSRFLYDATYIKLKNVSLSYTLPSSAVNKLGFLAGARVFVNADNLYTWFKDDWKGYDDLDIYGIGGFSEDPTLPISRTVTIGLNVTF
jgi:TonB-linked SusC/RagA family outer membrane protein